MGYKLWTIAGVLLLGLGSCKKEQKVQTTAELIVGKWYITNLASVLSRSGVVLSSYNETSFTNTDFVEYDSDGSGYYSKSTSQGPSLSVFTYTIAGNIITEHTDPVTAGRQETIKSITTNSLIIHAAIQVSDPNDPDVIDTEVDDLTYSRQL